MIRVAVIGSGHLADATSRAIARLPWLLTLALPDEADVVWHCVDMPVMADDSCDTESAIESLASTVRMTPATTPIVISTQVPVGFCARVEALWPEHRFAIQPENIRRASALADFVFQRRIVVGTRHQCDAPLFQSLFSCFCPDPNGILFMAPESAELVKHALNAFLATEIVFANELADVISTVVGADIDDVIRGFRSDRRVGKGPLQPGGPITGGTLLRDVRVLVDRGAGPLLSAIRPSNEARL